MRRTLTVILASDVAGYSRLVANHEEETIHRFHQAATVFTDMVKKYQGTVFNTAGDAILANFDSAVDAARCAIDIQDANNAQNASVAESERLLFRIGVAIGDVLVAENGNLLGDAVNVAARLESLAEPGGICISDDVRAQVLNKIRLNVVDLGDQNLRNIPRTIRVFKVVANAAGVAEQRPHSRRKSFAGIPLTWLISGVAAAGILAAAAFVWWDPQDWISVEHPFDATKIPLVTDRVRESLATYEQEADFKAVAISREGWGHAIGAPDAASARREALGRCRTRDEKGYCRIYAIGNNAVWTLSTMPLPADVRVAPLSIPLTADHVALIRWAEIPAQRLAAHLNEKKSKALAISNNGFWATSDHATRTEAARLAVERCSDNFQTPCLLLSVDGFLTVNVPRSHAIVKPFTLAGEKEMTEADKERIGQIYVGKDWRALAKGSLNNWYAVSGAASELAAVEQVLKACRAVEQQCALRAIGNFRVGERKASLSSEAPAAKGALALDRK